LGITNTHHFWDVASRQYEDGYDEGEGSSNGPEETDYRLSVGYCENAYRIVLEVNLSKLYFYNYKAFASWEDAEDAVEKMTAQFSEFTKVNYDYWTFLSNAKE